MNETAYLALEMLWKGMVSIFAVIVVLTFTVWVITHFIKDDDKDDTCDNV